MKKTLLFTLIAVSLSSCFSYKEVELKEVKTVKLNKVSNGGAEIQAGIQISNPNGYKIKIKKIEADMFINDKKIGSINLNKKVVLPRKSDDIRDFTVETKLNNLLSAMPSLLMGKDVNMKLKGTLKGKVFIFSRDFPIEAEKKVSASDLNLF